MSSTQYSILIGIMCVIMAAAMFFSIGYDSGQMDALKDTQQYTYTTNIVIDVIKTK